MREFHTIVVGAGSGGITVAVGLAGFGKEVALVEKKHVGGDCTNVGCVPSKTLIHLSKQFKKGELTPAEALARTREHRDSLRDHETEEIREYKGITLFEGKATFKNKNTVEIALDEGGTEEINAKNIVLATGSTPVRIPVEGLPDERLLTNESLFDLENLPEHLVIVGGGIIGCEMAFAFNRLGSKVTVVDLAPRLLGPLEPEVSSLIGQRLNNLGVDVYLKAKGSRYDAGTNTLYLDQEGKEVELENVDKVLLAVGRKPQLDVGLEQAGLKATKQGIKANGWGRTEVEGVYAIGDINPSSAFTHSANAQGRRLVQKLALPFLPVGKEKPYPSATFTDPEIAQVGPTLETLHKNWHPKLIKSYRIDLKDTDRGYTQFFDKQDGFVLIHAVRLTGRVLSATIVAGSASEMIPILTFATNNGVSMYKLSSLVFPYPTLSEAIKKAATNYVLETLPKLHKELGAYLAYRWSNSEAKESQGRPASATG